MKSMAVYSALFAMVNHCTAGINELSLFTLICVNNSKKSVDTPIDNIWDDNNNNNNNNELTVMKNWVWIMTMMKYIVIRMKLAESA